MAMCQNCNDYKLIRLTVNYIKYQILVANTELFLETISRKFRKALIFIQSPVSEPLIHLFNYIFCY